jgi:hypothetical protein
MSRSCYTVVGAVDELLGQVLIEFLLCLITVSGLTVN